MPSNILNTCEIFNCQTSNVCELGNDYLATPHTS